MGSPFPTRLLSQLEIQPTLIDIGASDAPPAVWQTIAPYSVYVGFDPDLREMHQVSDGVFRKAIVINQAITSETGSPEVPFYFTRSPYCSSSLRPHSDSLSNFLFSDLFITERQESVQATTLESVLNRLSLPGVDWLKIDTQGTDLRILLSLSSGLRAGILAIDIEPGLIDAYVGEDLFVDAHRYLTQSDFWLSNLTVQGAIRLRRATASDIMARDNSLTYEALEKAIRKSPAWCEARYLRTLASLAKTQLPRRHYVLLWIFALLDDQLGFALDVAIEHEELFGKDDISKSMKDESIRLIKRSYRMRQSTGTRAAASRLLRGLKRLCSANPFQSS